MILITLKVVSTSRSQIANSSSSSSGTLMYLLRSLLGRALPTELMAHDFDYTQSLSRRPNYLLKAPLFKTCFSQDYIEVFR
jgi:hypothetical protein